MLNVKALAELLTRNRDERLCRRWCLITPNGTLLAYSQPTDIKDLRKQVAITALTWQEHTVQSNAPKADADQVGMNPVQASRLRTLIIESETSNVLVRQLQPQLLLMLEGGIPPRKQTFEPRITAEGPDGEPLHDAPPADSALGSFVSSQMDSSAGEGNPPTSVLGLHRMKLDAMASAITSDFEQTGFKMPDETANKFF